MYIRQSYIFLWTVFIVVFSTSLSGHTQDFWEETSGPFGGDIYCLAINSNDEIFAGTNGNGIYRSTDKGDSWTQINSGLTNKTVYCLAINSSNDIFAGTSGGIFRSLDNGDNWEYKSPRSSAFWNIAFNPAGHIWVVGTYGVYRSTTNGDSWTDKGFYSPSATAIAINSSWQIFLASGSDLGATPSVYRSDNNGDNWILLDLRQKKIRVLSINLLGHVFAASDSGIYRSIDNGNSWNQINNGLTQIDVRALIINTSSQIFAGTYGGGVFRSEDNGDNWTPTNSGLINPFVEALATDLNGFLYAGTWGNGVFRSTHPTTSVDDNNVKFPQSYALQQNYPNPFNSATMIQYELPNMSDVRLEIFNILGEKVKTFVYEKQQAGYYTSTWNGLDDFGCTVTSGVYFYGLRTSEFVQVRKMILIR